VAFTILLNTSTGGLIQLSFGALARGIYLFQDLLNDNGNYFTYEDFKQKYGTDINFIYYFQLLASIPIKPKTEGASTAKPLDSSLGDPNVFQLSEEKNYLTL